MSRLIFGVLLFVTSCDPVDDKLVLTNMSSHKLFYLESPYENLIDLYEVTLREQGIRITYKNVVEDIEPRSSKNVLLLGSKGRAWENYIDTNCEGGKLRIYVFAIDTLKKYDFRDVAVNNRYVSKREFSVADLERVGWNVTIPSQ